MEPDQLKSAWQNAGAAIKTEKELLKMTRLVHHPTLKKIRVKLIAEIFLLAVFLLIYYDWFDGSKKPFYANVVLVSAVFMFIANDLIGYMAASKPVAGLNLKNSISNYLGRIKRLATLSIILSFLYSICLLVFFTSVIRFTREKKLLLVALAILLFQMLWWSVRVWRKWLGSLRQQVKDFDENE